MPLSTRRKLAVIGSAVATLAAVPFAAAFCLNAGIARAAVVQTWLQVGSQAWSGTGFTQCTPDPRIRCDSGAEDYARALA
jgi:tetrahydrodipicolinate N-succinyltransferase